jgi:hypothetical protein
MAQAEKRLRKLGARQLRLSIIKPFTKLQAFYERQGYAPAETREFPGVPFEILFMEKPA